MMNKVGDIVVKYESWPGEAVYNQKREIVNSGWPVKVSKVSAKVVSIEDVPYWLSPTNGPHYYQKLKVLTDDGRERAWEVKNTRNIWYDIK